MNICHQCDTENDINSKFCKNCGSYIATRTTTSNVEQINISNNTRTSIFFRSKKNIVITVIVLALIIWAIVIWNTDSSVEDNKSLKQTTTAMTLYEKELTKKYKNCLESEDYASALIFYTCDSVYTASSDMDLIRDSITERYPSLYYKFIANKNQWAVFPCAMRSSDNLFLSTNPRTNTLLNSLNFDKKYRMVPSCVEFADGQYGFAIHVADSSISNLYMAEDNSPEYATLVYDRTKTGPYMYDSTQNFGGYVSDGIINMIYEYVLNDKSISFKTDTGEIIVLTDEESQIWVETYALTFMCNKDSSIFKEKIVLSE